MAIAVLGAGILGSLTALELASRGQQVVLFERNEEALTEASLINEGKIHRGFVYAADFSFRTAKVMLDGAQNFETTLSKFVPAAALAALRTEPFEYVVHNESMLSVPKIEAHFERIAELSPKTGPTPVWQRLSRKALEEHYNPDLVSAAYITDEIAIDPHGIADLLRPLLRVTQGITLRTSSSVIGVGVRRKGYVVHLADQDRDGPFAAVVNALWANRWIADASLGHSSAETSLTRVKLGISLKHPSRVPTFTAMLGRFGDVVQYPSGRVYFSWYPDCMVGAIKSKRPRNWERYLQSFDGPTLAERSLAALTRICPPLADISPHAARNIAGGAIIAFGESDIDDPHSRLHQRHQIGISSWDSYHSVNTGKYTLGPLLASCVADRISPSARQ
jgi:hypothetical protein